MINQELFEKCIKKDPVAWDRFISLVKKTVLKSIKYELKHLNIYLPPIEIEDIMQDIFLMIWENNRLSQVHGPECIQAWLAITSIHFTHNHCRKYHFNRSKNTLSLDAMNLSDDGNRSLSDTLASSDPPIIERLDQKGYIKRIEKEISKLNHKQQLAIRLNLFDGLKQTEISTLMKLPKGTTSALLKRSKDFLKKKLGPAFMRDLKGL